MNVLSTEYLQAVAEGTDPTARRSAKYLLRLVTVEQRDRVLRHVARTGTDIAVAVNTLRGQIAAGAESVLMPAESPVVTLAA